MNNFLDEVSKPGYMDARTENGAIAHSTTGSTLVDQFSKSGSHRDRAINIVFAEQASIDAKFGKWALRFVFYLRLITRIVKFFDGSKSETAQRGQGNRDESYKRYLWYLQNKPELFYSNFSTFMECGSSKDVFEIMWYAKKFNIELDEERLLQEAVVSSDGGLYTTDDLLLKYLPLQKAASKVVTERAKYRNHIARKVQDLSGLNAKELRKLKSGGTAHTWQQLISKKLFGEINFHLISGKALTKIVSSKFLNNHGLVEKYEKWITGQPVAKFTGYVHELGMKVKKGLKAHEKMTYDKQFLGLLKTSKTALSNRRIISAIDRSSSMDCNIAGTTAMNIAESLGVYFANLLEGPFNKWVIRFSSRSEWFKLTGDGFCEQKLCMQWGDCPSNTDFQSIINSFVNVRKNKPSIEESEYPNTLLVVNC